MAQSTWGCAGCASRPRWQGFFCSLSQPLASPLQSKACLPCLPCSCALGAVANPSPACTPQEAAVPSAVGCGFGEGAGAAGRTYRPQLGAAPARPAFWGHGEGTLSGAGSRAGLCASEQGISTGGSDARAERQPWPGPDPTLHPRCWPLPGAAEQGQCPGPLQPPGWGNSGAFYQEKGLGLREGGFASPLCALGDEAMPRGCCTASSQWLVRISPKPRS